MGQVLFSALFTEEEDTSHRLEEQMVGVQWRVQERKVLKGMVQEHMVQEKMVVEVDLVVAAHKMEAGHRAVLSLELPLDHM